MDKDRMFREESKKRLKRIIAKKIRTTMIGALSAIERKFGFLMGFDEHGQDKCQPLDDEERLIREIYEELRREILDLGNNQIRAAEAEIDNHDVRWLRYNINLKVGG